jgi:hypothetical protein
LTLVSLAPPLSVDELRRKSVKNRHNNKKIITKE